MSKLIWQCTNCDKYLDGNPIICSQCGYTVYRPVYLESGARQVPDSAKPKTNLTLGDLVDQFIDGIAVLRPYTRVTKEAKRNLKLIIDTYVKTKVDENSRAYGGCLDCYGKGYATQESATIGYPDFVGDEGFKHHEHKMIFCDCARGGQLSHEVALQVEVAAVKTKQEVAN